MDLHVLAKYPLAAVVMNIVSFGLQFAEKIESGFKWMALLISITVGILRYCDTRINYSKYLTPGANSGV